MEKTPTEFAVQPKPGILVKMPDGKTYQLSRPKMKFQLEMEDSLQAIQDGKKGHSLRTMFDYLVALGLPRDIAEDLDMEDFIEIMAVISGSKKK